MTANSNYFRDSIKNKDDEFYTTYDYIDSELKYYKEKFKDKVVYCPCDDYRWSQFTKYFKNKFNELGLKKLICSCYNKEGHGTLYVFDGQKETVKEMFSNGDFRHEEVKSIMKKVDIVCTNPPFSLVRDFLKQLEENNKQYLFVCSLLLITHPFVFEMIKNRNVVFGVQGDNGLFITDTSRLTKCQESIKSKNVVRLKDSRWLTNVSINENNPENKQFLNLIKDYSESDYPFLDKPKDFAINVDSVANIPKNYNGIMAVPVSFIDKWNPNQFDILYVFRPQLNGKNKFIRMFIKKHEEKI